MRCPAAALAADHLAEVSDFLAVGTNDLVQYLLAADRTDQRLAALVSGVHPALLRLLRLLPRLAARHAVPVSVCGELASQPTMLALLMGLGVREFSMTPTALGTARRVVESERSRPCCGAWHAGQRARACWRSSNITSNTPWRRRPRRPSQSPNHRRPSVSEIPRVDKPWGYELHWAKTDRYVGKIIHIDKGHALSLQYHNKKDETIMLLSGKLLFEIQEHGQLVQARGRAAASAFTSRRAPCTA